MGRVIVLGSVNQDLHLHVERHPRSGETVMAGDVERRYGGKGGNQAVAAARAGAPVVAVVKVGDDAAGAEYLQRLTAFGVDTARAGTVGGCSTGTAMILNDAEGENLIVVSPGANHRFTADDLAVLDDLTAEDVLLAQLELPLDVVTEAVRAATARGARAVLNLAPFALLPADVLDLCDPVVVNEHEAAQLAEAGLEPASLLVTLGAAGSRWGEHRVQGRPVAPVVDTTGAGDSYCGTLAARLALGEDAAAAMAAAAGAAALTVQHHGAQPPLPA